MTAYRSRTIHPLSILLTLESTVLKDSDDIVMLGAFFFAKMTFEKHLRSVSRAAAEMLVSHFKLLDKVVRSKKILLAMC